MISVGRPNSSTMHTGMAPPQGLALSIFLSNSVHSMLGFCAKISAAHDPEGPPPITATFILTPVAASGKERRVG